MFPWAQLGGREYVGLTIERRTEVKFSRLNFELVQDLKDAGNSPDERVKKLTLMKCRHDANQRHDAPSGDDFQIGAFAKLALMDEQGDAILNIAIS